MVYIATQGLSPHKLTSLTGHHMTFVNLNYQNRDNHLLHPYIIIGYEFFCDKKELACCFHYWDVLLTPPNCAHIHCWVSVNIQQVTMNINRGNFFSHEDTPPVSSSLLYQMSFCQTHSAAICNKSKKKIGVTGRKVQPLLPYHQLMILCISI